MMQVALLAGGLGTRLSEETSIRPKPMVEIGGKPMLWHIMNLYAHHGYSEFLVACGYRQEMIKDYFENFYSRNSDFVVNLADGTKDVKSVATPRWKVGVVDTGYETQTGGRVQRLKSWLGNSTFMLTYGDGVGNVDIQELVKFHRSHGKLATVTAVHPPSRFGTLTLDGDMVTKFAEKPQTANDWINGGFFVLEPEFIEFLEGDACRMEERPLERVAAEGQLAAYRHEGFWHPMDTLRDRNLLERLWQTGEAPWKVWDAS